MTRQSSCHLLEMLAAEILQTATKENNYCERNRIRF